MGRVPGSRGMKATVSSEIAAARGALERADKIDVPDMEVVCGTPARTVDLLLRPVGMERLVEGRYARS